MDNKDKQKSYFDKLHKRKEEWINGVLSDPSGQALLDSGVDKYADQAHFIYELLQNADDANATRASFELKPDKLIFEHNGSRHFSISNPDTEKEDKASSKLGDINSIVSYGQSGKKESKEVKIGKFGAGFKSVFQYTDTPEIYDRDFSFKIEKQYIPTALNDKDPRNNKEDTMFVLPFINSSKAYDDISHKLEALKLPILFLNNLKEISCKYHNKTVIYTKSIEKTIEYDDCIAELIAMKNNGKNERLWLFSKKIEKDLLCSVGFFINVDGYVVESSYRDAFCYFPTKEYTALKFIVHAPFLLTESRENVKADQKHNHNMIDTLAELACSSIIHLRDIGLKENKQLINDNFYLNILPLNENDFTEFGDRDKISFYPFYSEILNMIKGEEILPCTFSNKYVNADNAYWARTPGILETFNDEHLACFKNNENAKFIFKKENNYNSSMQNRKFFYNYIFSALGGINFIRGAYCEHLIDDASLLENEEIINFVSIENTKWLFSLYKYISTNEKNKKIAKEAPIFLDSAGNASAIFEDNDEILYLPSEIKTLKSIHPLLLADATTKKLIVELGISEPSRIDQIKDGILKNYDDSSYNNAEDFEKIFKVYSSLDSEQQNELVEIISASNFRLPSFNYFQGINGFSRPKDLYFYNDNFGYYFEDSKELKFVSQELLTDKENEKILLLERLNLTDFPKIKSHRLKEYDAYKIRKSWPNHRDCYWEETYIDGCQSFISRITSNDNISDSVLLWNMLREIISNLASISIDKLLVGQYRYFTKGEYITEILFESTCLTCLRNEPWIYNKAGEKMSPSNTTIDQVNKAYELDKAGQILVKGLQIGDARFNEIENQRIQIGEYAEDLGLTPEEARIALELQARKKNQAINHNDNFDSLTDTSNQDNASGVNKNNTNNNEIELVESITKEQPLADIYKNIEEKRANISEEDNEVAINQNNEEEIVEQDEFIIPSVNSNEKIEKKEQQLAKEIEKIHKEEYLSNQIRYSKKYSFKWFYNLLLKERLLTIGSEEKEQKQLTAKFALAERIDGSDKTIILKEPIVKIPQSIEELADVPMMFQFDDGSTQQVVAEAFSILSYSIKAKVKSKEVLDRIDLSRVKEITIDFKQASFLLDELVHRFDEFGFDNDKNLQKDLTKDIKFIFGPPGTGKTTKLVRDFIIPKMDSKEKPRILILTPTNKAADVIINKIVQGYPDSSDYENWLIRFGLTQDENIEQMPIFKDKHVDIDSFNACTFVTTIYRLWYDFCIGEDGIKTNLRDIKWDYVIIDEASMVPLVYAVYSLYAIKPKEYIIAGDPFQIQPVITSEEWKDENIYSMVRLCEFKEHPNTVPHKYDVELLTKQYRSIPEIGNIFSKLTYNGVLKHHKTDRDQIDFDFGLEGVKTLNLIRYPVSKYESIYASKHLNGTSSYHVYSALLTFELAKYLNNHAIKQNKMISLGIISPYRAQADIVEKLCRNIPKNNNFDIQVGTIHSFQGDECDIVICLFNTPPYAISSDKALINNQKIINVAISRARSYLFVITPNDETPNFEDMPYVNRLIGLFRETDSYSEYDSSKIEKMLFNDTKHLETNAFSTSHQSVNIYEKPEKKYEIRAEDHAIDIQTHETNLDSEKNGNLKDIDDGPKKNDEKETTEPVKDIKIDRSLDEVFDENKKKELYNLIAKSNGIKSKELATKLNVNKSDVTKYLYANLGKLFVLTSDLSWKIK